MKKISAALGAGIMMISAATAGAVTFNPNPPVSGQSLTITSDSTTLEQGKYRVSICSVKRFGIGVPACAPSKEVDHPGGQLSVTMDKVSSTMPNAHHIKFLPAQPETFSCDTEGLCEVLIVKHDVWPKQEIERASITIK